MESYSSWIHIIFFATWLGGNLFCLAIFLPACRSLPPGAQWQARRRASHGLNMVTAVSAPLVVLSGSVSFLLPEVSIGTARGHAILIAGKATLTLVMIVNHLLQAFWYPPGLPGSPAAWRTWVRLLTFNVILGFAAFFLGLSLV